MTTNNNEQPQLQPQPQSQVQTAAPRSFADTIGLNAAMRMLRRRMLLVSIVGLIAAAAVFALLMLRQATYTATALLILNPQADIANPGLGAAAADLQSARIASEIELLRSPVLLSELATELGLQRNGENDASVTETLQDAIVVRRRADTFVIEIAANAGDPLRAQLMANTFADIYLSGQWRGASGGGEFESEQVSQRLAELRNDAQAAETALEAFRAESDGSDFAGDQIGDLQTQLRAAQAELASAESRNRQMRELRQSDASIDAIASALGSDTLNALRSAHADIVARQTDLEGRYLPAHPDVQAVRQERAESDARIEREVQRLAASYQDEVNRARARVQSLQQSLRAAAAELSSRGDPSDRMRELERQASESRELYDSYLERYRDVAGQTDFAAAGARLLSRAAAPAAPSSPHLRLALALALGAGLLLGLGAGAIAELFDQSVKNADDLEQKVGHPAIASIPTISKRMMRQMPPAERHPPGYLVGRPMSAFTEALRVLRTVIVYSKLDFSVKVVAVTSALPDEGKTTISMCLARVAAMSGQKVCVVDCDLRKQSINDVIDIEADIGILQVLAGEAEWRSAIVRDPNSEAHVLPIAASGFTPRDVFGSDAMAKLIADLRSNYDLVILDCAPILAVAETRIVVAQADTTVLVARAGRTAIGAMRTAVAQTQNAGGKVLGIALNYVVPRWQSYSDSLYFDESKSYYSVS